MKSSWSRAREWRAPARLLLRVLLMIGVTTTAAHARWVVTFHYDNYRTGWNQSETVLTPSNVAGGHFRLLRKPVQFDEQVDAQPLFAGALTINGKAHKVLYVVTQNNTVYALDAATGATLNKRTLGPAVPVLVGGCGHSTVFGISSTPVIDRAASILYVMADIYENGSPVWRLYGLDLATLHDKLGPVDVAASAKLANGSTFAFNAAVYRQRPALLEANGNIYAAFGSICDFYAATVRGLVLGWKAGSLAPLPANRLTNRLAHSANNFFLSTLWMSGNGIAAGAGGNLYFTTGNSDPSGTSYHPWTNLANSVVRVAADLSQTLGFFTPSDSNFGVHLLDQQDSDFGAGGVMLLPPQTGTSTRLMVAAGKSGQMYLMNAVQPGGYGNGTNRVLDTQPIGPCWCGESYFTGGDGIGRIVSSGGVGNPFPPIGSGAAGGQIKIWKVLTSPELKLRFESQSKHVQPGQDGGFFTSVSSKGRQNPIVWAVGRPQSSTNTNLTLYAYDPVAAASGSNGWLFPPKKAGAWPNLASNANVVPVVADGQVYVAGYKELYIFGLGTGPAVPEAALRPVPPARPPLPPGDHEIFGTIETLGDGRMTLRTRQGGNVTVAVRTAIDADRSVALHVGGTVGVTGGWDAAHLLHATSIVKAKTSPLVWPADR